MGRLKAMPQRIAALPSRVAKPVYDGEAERSRLRRKVKPWRAWYGTKRWQQLRWSVLVAATFTCARCGRSEADTALLVADHKLPHRGDPALFWDRRNLQCMCKPCHDGAKQREERARW